MRATVISYSSINLTWEDTSCAALGYRVEHRTANGSYVTIANLNRGTTTFTDSGLEAHTRYYYRVQAYNLLGVSNYSNEVSACTANYYDRSPNNCWLPDENDDQSQPVVIRLNVGSSAYYVNWQLRNMDVVPFISGGRILIPVNFWAEAMGADVNWNDYEKKATISFNGG